MDLLVLADVVAYQFFLANLIHFHFIILFGAVWCYLFAALAGPFDFKFPIFESHHISKENTKYEILLKMHFVLFFMMLASYRS